MALHYVILVVFGTINTVYSSGDSWHFGHPESVSQNAYLDLITKLDPAEKNDTKAFNGVMNEYLTRLMATFRGKISELYKMHACENQLCFNSDDGARGKS